MTKYITLIRFTEKGAQGIKQSPARADAFSKTAVKAGVKVEGLYWTAGAYDGVLILSADQGQKVLRCLSELVAQGNVRTETLQAFDASEFGAIVGA
jgi:uncharacterized protein with GYD domain